MKEICKKSGLPVGTKSQMRDAMLQASGSVYTEVCKNFASVTGKSGGLLHGHCQHGSTYNSKILLLPEGTSDYAQTIMSMDVLPTIVISDIAHILSRHTNLNYGLDIFWPWDGRISDPDNKPRTEDIKGGRSKVNFDFIPRASAFKKDEHDRRLSPHPMTGHTSRLSIFDRFHETGQKGSTLRRMGNIEGFVGRVNTQAAEQANSVLKKKGWFMNE